MISYTNNLKNREFGKEAPQNSCLERATIADRQGASEEKNSEKKPTPPKPDSSGCLCIKARHIVKTYPSVPLLNSISLDLPFGQSIAVCGRSGEGKTTLLHILGTLEAPDSGEIEIAGQRLTRANASQIRNQQIGFIFQAYNLLEDFTALENVLMPARIARKPVNRQKGIELLAQVSLEERADFPARLLSGGERQRVAIARALCNDPSLILADEPTGNLDRASAKMIGDLLLSLKKSLIIVTHDEELAALCHQRYLLKEGLLKKKS